MLQPEPAAAIIAAVSRLARFTRRPIVLTGAILLLTFLSYIPALSAGFVWDDDRYVTENALLTEPGGLRKIWFSTESPSQYFPLTYTSFWVERPWWGLNPRGYHAVNIALHAINALLVWQVLLRLNVPGAFLAGCLFAVHPVNVESVAWISERKNLLCGMFYWLALLAWMRFAASSSPPAGAGETPVTRKRVGWYLAAFASFVLAMFAKTTGCTLPAAMVLVLWVRREKVTVRRWAQITPFVLWGLAMGAFTVWWEQHHQYTSTVLQDYPLIDRLLVAGRATWFYLLKLIVPVRLAFSYPRWSIDPHAPIQYLPLIGCLLAAGALYWIRKKRRYLVAGIVFFVAAHLPTLGLIPLYTFIYTFVADHYQYLAMVGILAIAAALLVRLPAVIRPVAITIIVIALGALTFRQARAYADAETLWRDTLRKNPRSFMAHNNLGDIAFGRDDLAGAASEFRAAIAIEPQYAKPYVNLARVLLRRGDRDGAYQVYRDALSAGADDAELRYDLATLLAEDGHIDQAIAQYRRAIELYPDYEAARVNLAVLYARSGRLAEAEPLYLSALAINPRSVAANDNLAQLYLRTGRYDQAIERFEAVLRERPDNLPVMIDLGRALAASGKLERAADVLERALRRDKRSVDAMTTIALVDAQRGESARAVERLRRALALQPDYAPAQQALRAIQQASPSQPATNDSR